MADIVEHHFVIRYKTESDRVTLVNEVIELIKYYQLQNFFVEEELDISSNKILYNHHTLTCISDTNCSNIRVEFKKYFR